jgi:hypothetical protein
MHESSSERIINTTIFLSAVQIATAINALLSWISENIAPHDCLMPDSC